MRTHQSFAVATLLIALLSVAAPAIAQESPDRRPVELAVGSIVNITTRDGRTVRGRLLTTSAVDVAVADGRGPHRIPWTDIRQVDRRPRGVVPKSTLVGVGIGLGFGLVTLAAGGCSEEGHTYAFECVGFFTGIGAGAGALAGFIINTSRPSRTVYRANQRRELTLTPVIAPRRAGVAGTIRW